MEMSADNCSGNEGEGLAAAMQDSTVNRENKKRLIWNTIMYTGIVYHSICSTQQDMML